LGKNGHQESHRAKEEEEKLRAQTVAKVRRKVHQLQISSSAGGDNFLINVARRLDHFSYMRRLAKCAAHGAE